jgi:hypothetical protein
MNTDDQITVTVKDGGFIEFDDCNGKALCRQILEVNVEQAYSGWSAVVYPTHDKGSSIHFQFESKTKANDFLELIYETCVDLDRMNAGFQTDQIKKVRTFMR